MSEGIRGPIIVFDNFFTSDQCSDIIQYAKRNEGIKAKVGGDGTDKQGVLDENIRKNNLYNISSNYYAAAAMTGAAMNVNHDVFKFNITHAHQSDLLEYGPGGKFNPHIDSFISANAQDTRKLTTLLILNNEYEGGELSVYHQNGKATFTNKNKGALIIFPSYMTHGVVPVTSGIRYSMVNWLLGPSFI